MTDLLCPWPASPDYRLGMFESVVALLYMLALWAIGRAVLMAGRADRDSWLAMPVGLSVVGIAGNALYFAAGLSVHVIQWILVAAVLPCVVFLLRRRLPRFEWEQLLAVLGLFLVLALPAYLGGEQYYVFRGNHGDHFNYINMTLALRANPYAAYVNAAPEQFLATDVLAHGLQLVPFRPAAALAFALMLPGKTGNLHLLAFLYVTALMSLIFPAACFAWARIVQAYGRFNRGVGLTLVFSAAYVVGFWGQYLFDINAWSHMSAVSMLLGFVFAYARLLWRLTAAPQARAAVLLPDVLPATILAAGAFLFYPENTVAHLAMVGGGTVVWCGLTRRLPGLRTVVLFAALLTTALMLSSAPFWEGTVGFVVTQFGPAAGDVPEHWWRYFDSYWQGLRASPPADVACATCLSGIANRVLAVAGMYFLTPDYAAMPIARYAWMATTILLALVTIYNLSASLSAPHFVNDTAVFLVSVVISGLPFMIFYLANDALWNLGKFLAFVSPYLFMVLCLPLVAPAPGLTRVNTRVRPLVTWLSRGAVFVLVGAQFGFGAARVWAARDPLGIGYDNATYPSILVTTIKSSMVWQIDSRTFSACTGVHLSSDVDRYFVEFLKQKLAYARVSYFSAAPVLSSVVNGREVGRQPSIPTDCNAVSGGTRARWREVSSLPPFDGTIDFLERDPHVVFTGFDGPGRSGSWTHGPRASITLPALLPERFTMELDVAGVLGPNASQLFRVRAGGQERIVSFPGPGTYSIPFERVRDGTEFEILIPAPTSPLSLGLSTDPRALGLALQRIRILRAD